jgi:hypothetical protein
MADSLQSLLAGKNISEPPESKLIREFVLDKFKVAPLVAIGPKQIVIGVKSAALAGALRPYLLQIQELCQTDKKLTIRISG